MIHMIQQQYVHVELNGTELEGLELQRSLPDFCHHRLTPAIEQTLERSAPQDEHLLIERLEIDVGPLTLENLEQELPGLITLTLENAIEEQIFAARVTAAALEDKQVQLKTARQSIDEAFVYFLETGSLPWSFRLPEDTHLEQAILSSWQEAVIPGKPSSVVSDSILQALASTTSRKRLIQQFSPAFLETLLAILSPAAKIMVDEMMSVMQSTATSLAKTKLFKDQFWQSVFAAVAVRNRFSARHLVAEFWGTLSSTDSESRLLALVLEQNWPGITKQAWADPNPVERAETISSAINLSQVAEPRSLVIPEHPESREGIYIENAGLILLHPLLPQLFSALGIADEKNLLQPERALCLLHFLATGQSSAPEYDLILPKILCNIPLLTVIDSDLQLTPDEIDEAVALLEAVIGHWTVLRNTSPDSLRGTFLLRSGKVTRRKNDDWLLQVESSSVDILLNQLPWSISMIKLPWMDHMLWLDWGDAS